MAMPAGLITLSSDIQLQNCQGVSKQSRRMSLQLLVKPIHLSSMLDRARTIYPMKPPESQSSFALRRQPAVARRPPQHKKPAILRRKAGNKPQMETVDQLAAGAASSDAGELSAGRAGTTVKPVLLIAATICLDFTLVGLKSTVALLLLWQAEPLRTPPSLVKTLLTFAEQAPQAMPLTASSICCPSSFTPAFLIAANTWLGFTFVES